MIKLILKGDMYLTMSFLLLLLHSDIDDLSFSVLKTINNLVAWLIQVLNECDFVSE